jgi:phosphoribosylformylglycinamidine cyclo-ligase
MTEEADTDDELTYAEAGVDIEASEAATAALLDAVGNVVDTEYAGLLEVGDQYLSLATDGVGTKLLVADAIEQYDTIGIDCIAMNVNDLVAAGVEPLAFVDYLAVEDPAADLAEAIGQGLADGAEAADIALLGGETAVMPEVIDGFDLAGACVGLAPQEAVFEGTAEPGDALVGVPSSGIHSNGLTLARRAVTRAHDYDEPFPPDEDRTIGEVLLEPTRLYVDLLDPMREHAVRAAAHVTGGGWTNLERLGDYRYEVDDPLPAQPVFEFVQECGEVSDAEMHRTFNMGTGFVAALPAERADQLATAVDGQVIGTVESGSGVSVRGLEL